jgi:hypothetical protein
MLRGPMKVILTRMLGAVLFGGAVYVAWARLPSAYPAAVKLTGAAFVTRSAVDRLATVYLSTGAVGGFGLALIVWPIPGPRAGARRG